MAVARGYRLQLFMGQSCFVFVFVLVLVPGVFFVVFCFVVR